MRTPLQGVRNIIRFNWHWYVLASVSSLAAITVGLSLHSAWLAVSGVAILSSTAVSLIVSTYVYDLSGLYEMPWIEELPHGGVIANIHAGFDETSAILSRKHPHARITVVDCYDPKRHTEISVRRARMKYEPYPGTIKVSTSDLPFIDRSVSITYLTFAAHEIRDDRERVKFFREVHRSTKVEGKIFVTEHVRDLPNILAYNVGSFHFLRRATWLETFAAAGLRVESTRKHTPFVTTFTLTKDGVAS